MVFQLSTIGRCEYDKTCTLLVRLFDESAQRYQELVNGGVGDPSQLSVQEGKRYCSDLNLLVCNRFVTVLFCSVVKLTCLLLTDTFSN